MANDLTLNQNVTEISGIGPKTGNYLQKLDITTTLDLLRHFPNRYLDFTHPCKIASLTEKNFHCFTATLKSFHTFFTKSGKQFSEVIAEDETGSIKLIWFNNPYIRKLIKEGEVYTVAGKPSFWINRLAVISPIIEEGTAGSKETQGLVPIYPQTEGINSRWLRSKISTLLSNINIEDPLQKVSPPALHLIKLDEAYQHIHFPDNKLQQQTADQRLSFDEHLKINLQNILERQKLGPSISIKIDKDLDVKGREKLPFELTLGQKNTITALCKDLHDSQFTHRLIQGDTGSGKTATLIVTGNQCLANHTSVVILAPTEILARQHFDTFKKYSLYPQHIQLVTASSHFAETNEPQIYIGTHALLTQLPRETKFPISLLAIDEQHKFGVKQREELLHHNPIPHLVNLSATPIPRTVALGLLGDIELSSIAFRPHNMIPTKTFVVDKEHYKNSVTWLKEELTKGNQLFVVCPNINDHQEDIASVTATSKRYIQLFSPEFPVYSLHGAQKHDLQQKTLEKFKSTPGSILVATSLIEVGIDIPKANIMVIHSAERFGLAQLHQLRGRVGRGGEQGYCFLVPSKDEDTEIERLQLLQKYDSGLKLAKMDLRLRGAGDVLGQKQHGALPVRLKYFWSRKSFLIAKALAKKIAKDSPKQAMEIVSKLNNC